MITLGLTGSVGMGKTEAAKEFARLGFPVFDADQEVHRLLAEDRAVAAKVASVFPEALAGATVDRARIAERVFADPAALAGLEKILHPEVRKSAAGFVARARAGGAALVVLEIPLLYESGAEALCDAVAVVTAPWHVQEARAMARPGMTRERLAAMRARQMPDAEKRHRADFVIETGDGRPKMLREIRKVVKILCQKPEGQARA